MVEAWFPLAFIALLANTLAYLYNLYRQPPIWIILVPGDLVLLACIIRGYFAAVAGVQHAIDTFPWFLAQTGPFMLRLLLVLVNFSRGTILESASVLLVVLKDFVLPGICPLLRAALAVPLFLARHGNDIRRLVVSPAIAVISPYLFGLSCFLIAMALLEVMVPPQPSRHIPSAATAAFPAAPQAAILPPRRSALAQRTVEIEHLANARDAAKARADASRFRNSPSDKGTRGGSSGPGHLKTQIVPGNPRSAANSRSTRGESSLNDEDFDSNFARVDAGASEHEDCSEQQGLAMTGREKPGTTTRSGRRQTAGSPGESMIEVSEDTVNTAPVALSSRRGLVSNSEGGRSRNIDRYPTTKKQFNSTTAEPPNGGGSRFLAYICRKRDEFKRARRVPIHQPVGPPSTASSGIDLAGDFDTDIETFPFTETDGEASPKSSHRIEQDQDFRLPVTDDRGDGTTEINKQTSKRPRASKEDHAGSGDIASGPAKTCSSAAPRDIAMDEDELSASWDYFEASEEVPRSFQLNVVAASNAAHNDLGPEPRISRSTVTQQDRDDAILAATYLDLGPSNGLRLRWHNHPVSRRRF